MIMDTTHEKPRDAGGRDGAGFESDSGQVDYTLPISFTRYRNDGGKPLSKTYTLADGVVVKTASAQMGKGVAERIRCDFADFPAQLAALDSANALGFGAFPDRFGDTVKIVTADKEDKAKPQKGIISRTQKWFEYRKGPGILMFDRDPSPYGPAHTPESLMAVLCGVFPPLAECACHIRPSVSACVVVAGQEPGADKGFHIYIPVADASDIPRFGKALFSRLWLAGHGFIALSKNGAMLERSIIDAAVFSPERLDFAGRPVIKGKGLEFIPPAGEYRQGGYLDIAALPDMDEAENERFQELTAEAKAKIKPKADKVGEAYDAKKITEMVGKGVPEDEARSQVERMRAGGHQELPPGFVLTFATLGAVTVADVLLNPARYDRQALADPIEGPEYGRTTAKFYANAKTGKPCIHSQAHSAGMRYFPKNEDGKTDKTAEKLFPGVETPEQCSQRSQCSHDADDHNEDGELSRAIAWVESAISACGDDPGKLASEAFNEAAQLIREQDPEEWFRLRVKLKQAKPSGVLLGDIDKATRPYGEGEESTIADALVELAVSQGELFHNTEGVAFFTLNGSVAKTFKLDTKGFGDWLSYAYYMDTKGNGQRGCAASEMSMKTAITTLSGIALHDGGENNVYLRAAPWQNGYLVDLCNEAWQVVEVLPTGWRVLDCSPIPFWRPAAARPLPMPVAGGDLALLWKFANIPDECRKLVTAWNLEAWRPDTPYPVLELTGQQGTAKSSSQDKLRRIIDPNAVNLRSAPKTVEDVFVGAGCNWLVSFNNLSHLSAQQQDALCNLATGGGFAARTLYTNAEETLIECKRPVVINGIVPLVTAQDLTDRVIHVDLPEIEYREETELEAEFADALPSILGGLFDLFVLTLAQLPKVKINRPPRMSDFARLGEAMHQAQGGQAGEFVHAYEANRRQSIARGLDASLVAAAIIELSDDHHQGTAAVFEGTMKHLLERLESRRATADAWPKSPRGLGDILRRQRPALAAVGVSVEISQPGREGVKVTIRKREHGERRECCLEVSSPEKVFSGHENIVEGVL